MNRWQWFQLMSFNVIWLVAVLGGNTWIWIPLLILAINIWLSPTRSTDIKIIPLAILGLAVDSILIVTGVFYFSELPFWLATLWVGFVLSFGHSLHYLAKLKIWLLLPLGAIAGTWTYMAGWKLGAVTLPLGTWNTVFILLPIWALLLPVLVKADNLIRVRT